MSTPTEIKQPKPGSKQALFLQRLEGDGASVPDLMEVTGWQSHTVRAAVTGLRKRGFSIDRLPQPDKAPTLYRLKPPAHARKRARG